MRLKGWHILIAYVVVMTVSIAWASTVLGPYIIHVLTANGVKGL